MEGLLELAARAADQAEVVHESRIVDEVSFENATLKEIESSRSSGFGLTLIKDGRRGYAYTRNLTDRGQLVRDALSSLATGVEVGYSLSAESPEAAPDAYDRTLESLGTADMVADCERIGEHLRAHCDGEVDVFSSRELTGMRLRNTAGFDAATQVSEWTTYAGIRFPGTHASLWKAKVAKGFDPLGDSDLDDLAGMHARSGREVRIAPGRMKVMFVPQSMYTLMWRLRAATDGRHVYERVSPLVDKLGDSVFDPQLTIEDRPLDDARPGARAFDDEGTPCADRSIVEEGVLRGYCFDRTYAWRAGVQPTGNGYRPAIDRPVAGTLRHLRVLPGRHSTAELLSEMGRGVVVVGALGAHSGNILHGDYSIGLAPGLYVEGGEIVGRVKDAMVAGNIYETMRNVVAVGRELEPGESGWYPPIVFDDVRVSVAS